MPVTSRFGTPPAVFYAPRLLTIQLEGEALVLYALNDINEEWSGDVELSLRGFEGGTVAEAKTSFVAPPHTAFRVGEIERSVAVSDRPESEVIVAQSGADRALWFFDVDLNLVYPQPAFEASLEQDGETQRLTISAQTLLRDACVFADRLDSNARTNDQMVTLLPGESFTWEITSAQPLTGDALTASPVFQCANRFGKAD